MNNWLVDLTSLDGPVRVLTAIINLVAVIVGCRKPAEKRDEKEPKRS